MLNRMKSNALAIMAPIILIIAFFVWPTPYHQRQEPIGILYRSPESLMPSTGKVLENCQKKGACIPVYAKTRGFWLVGETECLTWLFLDQKRSGVSPWHKWRSTSYAYDGNGLRIFSGSESRMPRTFYDEDIQEAVRSGSFGDLRVTISAQEWVIMPISQYLRIVMKVTNTSSEVNDLCGNLFLVSEKESVILGSIEAPKDSNSMLSPLFEHGIKMGPGESVSMELFCMINPHIARQYEPLQIMNSVYGWLIPVNQISD
ncbi:MAG: hypothetical protein PHR28_08395 [candidate division Zixibacteria bacterium]|nr:hypothetical protein [candidate division Zixibacteria bacterium]